DCVKLLEQSFSQFADLFGAEDEAQQLRLLRIFRKCQSAAIATLELSNQIPVTSSSYRISLLADLMIKQAHEFSINQLKPRFGLSVDDTGRRQNLVVLGMGKLGGLELNFSSDIDLIFFYANSIPTQEGSRSVEASRYFQRVATQIIKLLDEVTEEGFVFRVDMRLRPYGDSGALVMSFAQAEEYYQEQGREWERFAMVRARVINGSPEEQGELQNIITPFCFRRYIDYGVIDSIRNMKSMIVREVRRKGLVGNIKLGAGGIRELEFIVQALQLIQGGRDKRLQERSVFKVLPQLVAAKLLPQNVAEFLGNAYRLLRRVEHCIQELEEKQTQQLPDNLEQQKILHSVMQHSSWQSFTTELGEIQTQVHLHFNELLGEERQQGLAQNEFFHSLAEGHVSYQQFVEKSQSENWPINSEQSLSRFIEQLERFQSDSSVVNLSPRGAKRLRTFFPALLAACVQTDKMDVTLERLLKVLYAILKRTAYLELLSENPPILQHLVDLAGKSEWVTKHLSEYPILLDELLYPNSLYEPLQTADLESELRQSLLRIDPLDEEEILDTLRGFKQINELRVAAALLSERLSISQVSRYLTQLAEVILNAAIKQCWQMISLRHGNPEGLAEGEFGFAVIGYGKLGGRELGFGSDLDLVFLFDQPMESQTTGERSLSNNRFYTRFAQKLIHFLSTRTNLGLLYEVDMRLRPSGSSGLLVSHVDAYQEYQMESAWTWEHQALIRARFVAGDPKVMAKFETIRNATLNKPRECNK
ncbi:MAG: bifunctional [glutamate--ammonia ligase]-adenylyl-L-tyrosine phosphorylase/[glutamate--ammonia-ligase] adenylyltransferase, partial [Kangiellaceae bacterium]|nr:bifunctional [glutamate--ammonia ligase]-adenylyl-L-tyrosine phosphorylase/[glutamate--ammonia-ligase] adenylyltransferase [Kangiellaceae bacterium]